MAYRHISDEKLVDYALGLIEGNEKQEIEEHLFSCEQCLREWRSWQLLLNKQTDLSTIKAEVKQKVFTDIKKRMNRKHRVSSWKPVYAVVSFCMVMLIIFSLNFSSQEDQSTSQAQTSRERTVHVYPIESQRTPSFQVQQLDTSFVKLTIPDLIWIHYYENRPIVNVMQHESFQFIDCQYIVVSRKQRLDWQSDVIHLQHQSESFPEEADIYLKCVR